MSFLKNLSWRYATTKFGDTRVSDDDLEKILESIRMSPSAFGIQPYHVIVIRDKKAQKMLQPLCWDQEQIVTCSHLLVFCADNDTDRCIRRYMQLAQRAGRRDVTDDPEYEYEKECKTHIQTMGPEWTAKQTYIALGFALAACVELYIDSCPIEGFEPDKVKVALHLPKHLDPKVLLALGYRHSSDTHAHDPKIRASKEDLFSFTR